jgi:transposase-like protein
MITRAPRLPENVRAMIFSGFVDDKSAVATTIDVGRAFYEKKPAEWKYKGGCWHASFHITVLRYYRHFREKILESQHAQYPKLGGELEINLTYFGGHRRRKKEEEWEVKKLLGIKVGKQVAQRTSRAKKFFERPVLGILQRGGPVILLPVESRARPFLELMIRQIVEKGSIVYTDKEKGLGEIKMLGFKHRDVNHSKHYVDKNGWHINGIESVFREARAVMRKNFKGVPKSTLDLHIKEREFRYNHRHDLETALTALLQTPDHHPRPPRSGTHTPRRAKARPSRRRSRTGSGPSSARQ